ncbi:dynamin GTPase [Blastomyces silverae]|uniref:Dynamin GTPase n=1 Tax=Blastomyces silverae TaxID=2060906 RepID=A0A0H1BP88_9EURO|nr:dynamin GTPase [Blastomyces silverae]
MSLESLDHDALRQLQSEQSQLLDVIDELRSLRLGQLVELPQLVVCGDQSSGKSSVLEAISRVRFPVKGGVCTRFATEVILRRKPESDFKVTIEPGPSRTDDQESRRFHDFAAELPSDTPLETVIEEAKKTMGISLDERKFGGFSDDVLKIEICGPDKPGLTLVDLPGLYHAKSKEQGANGIPVVRNLVKSYLKNPRSIILAVISAKNEYNNQEILDLAETFDKKRERTLAIVTKPDTLPKNSDEERIYIELMNNERIKLQLGWHALRNRDYETRDISDEARDERERDFFAGGPWTDIPQEFVGIDTLRLRLSSMLLDHISRSLPALVSDIEEKICERQRRMEQLGDERTTPVEKRGYLLNLSNKFDKITSQAMNGMYLDEFFRGLCATSATSLDIKRLRAIIRELNEEFALEMMERGSRRRIIRDSENKIGYENCDRGTTSRRPPPTILISDLEKEVSEMARKNRGIELPGTSNQLLVGELFRDQCKPWESIAQAYLTKVCQRIRSFTEVLLQHLADKVTYRPLMSTVLNPALEAMSDKASVKLQELFSYHKRGHPLPFNKSFLAGMKEFRQDRLLGVLEQKLLKQPSAQTDEKLFSLSDIRNATAAEDLEVQGDGFAAREIIDLMELYYNMALTTFIDNVAILVTENCLILPLESILTPLTINAMEEEEINRLAAEPTYVQRNREQLRSDLSKLNAALRICKHHSAYTEASVDFQGKSAQLSDTINGQNQESPAKRTPFASVNDSVPVIVTPARATLGPEEGENPTKPGPKSNIKSNPSPFISPTDSSKLFGIPASQEPVGSQKSNQPPFGSKPTESIFDLPPRSTSGLFGSSQPSRSNTPMVSSTSLFGQHIASDRSTAGGFGPYPPTSTAQPPGSVSLFAKSEVAPAHQSLTPGESGMFKNPANSLFTYNTSASSLFQDSPKLPALAKEPQPFSASRSDQAALHSAKTISHPAGQPPSTKPGLTSGKYQG